MKKIKMFEEFTEIEWFDIKKNKLTYIDKLKDIDSNKVLRQTGFDFIINYETYKNDIDLILNKIKIYNIDNFIIKGNMIIPDNEFIDIIIELNEFLYKKINITDFKFIFDVNDVMYGINTVDSTDGIPNQLFGYGLGYKIYKKILYIKKIIMSETSAKPEAINVWYHLLHDNELMAATSTSTSIVAMKNISDIDFIYYMNRLKPNRRKDLIFDSFFTEKINQNFISVENYKNIK